MRTALDELELDPAHDAQLWDYLEKTSDGKALRLADPYGRDGFITRDSLIETIYRSLTRPPAHH